MDHVYFGIDTGIASFRTNDLSRAAFMPLGAFVGGTIGSEKALTWGQPAASTGWNGVESPVKSDPRRLSTANLRGCTTFTPRVGDHSTVRNRSASRVLPSIHRAY